MNHSAKHVTTFQAVAVWLFLVLATLTTGWLADHHGLAGQWTVAVVMLVAACKARAVILYYMEVKYAPVKLKLVFEAWVLTASGLILALWFLQSGT